jgi:hypothetical protein
MTTQGVVDLLKLIIAAWPTPRWDYDSLPDTAQAWERLLFAVTDEEALAGLHLLIDDDERTSNFPPAINEIARYARTARKATISTYSDTTAA